MQESPSLLVTDTEPVTWLSMGDMGLLIIRRRLKEKVRFLLNQGCESWRIIANQQMMNDNDHESKWSRMIIPFPQVSVIMSCQGMLCWHRHAEPILRRQPGQGKNRSRSGVVTFILRFPKILVSSRYFYPFFFGLFHGQQPFQQPPSRRSWTFLRCVPWVWCFTSCCTSWVWATSNRGRIATSTSGWCGKTSNLGWKASLVCALVWFWSSFWGFLFFDTIFW